MLRYNYGNPPQHDYKDSRNSMLSIILWFNTFYTQEKRVICHLLMWLLFGALVEFGLLIDYQLSFYNSLFFLGRTLIGNAAVFYLFFYLILPHFILKKKLLTGFALIIASILLWRINEYLAMLIASKYANLSNTGLIRQVNEEVATGLYYVVSPTKFIGGLIFIMYSLSPLFCLKTIIEVMKSAYKTTEIEKSKSALEVAFLKSQLNPHFLFNTLNTIYLLNRKNDSAASEVILELSDALRYTLYESNMEQVLLENELNFLRNYVELEKARQSKDTKIEFNCDLSNITELTIAPLLTFPFIENAFKHGLGTSLKNAWLMINISITDSVFCFSISNSKDDENNGVPLKEYVGGIGVANTKRRLALLYPGKHSLKIENSSKEYNINLKINLNNE
jgi:two-component system LytT family sensor kinase